MDRDTVITPSVWRRLPRVLLSMGCVLAIAFGAGQAFATANPQATAKNYCPDVAPCLSVCGDAGGIYYGLLPNGEALCDCCAPE